MENQNKQTNLFSFLYRTRVKVNKDDTSIVNLSVAFVAFVVVFAPWIAIIGLIAALALGYRFSMERNAQSFTDNFQEVVKDAAFNVKSTVDSVVGSRPDTQE
ncbi:MAG: DUF4342 domain-containing protein [Eubacteriales bacterium]|nr:DUF4342 domain-containing protein [Eubacteriales bacterium]